MFTAKVVINALVDRFGDQGLELVEMEENGKDVKMRKGLDVWRLEDGRTAEQLRLMKLYVRLYSQLFGMDWAAYQTAHGDPGARKAIGLGLL